MRRISSLKMLGLALYGSTSQKRNNKKKYFIAPFGKKFSEAKPKQESMFKIYYSSKAGVVMALTRRDTRPITAIVYELKSEDWKRAKTSMTPVWLLKKNIEKYSMKKGENNQMNKKVKI